MGKLRSVSFANTPDAALTDRAVSSFVVFVSFCASISFCTVMLTLSVSVKPSPSVDKTVKVSVPT